MKTTTILLALAFGITACSASTDGQLPTQDDNSTNASHAYSSLISKTAAYLEGIVMENGKKILKRQ